MSRIEWDKDGQRFFETGTSNGVLYTRNALGVYDNGYAWNGLTAVSESPSGAESNKQYADNRVYANLTSAEEFAGTIEAFTSPPEFDQCDGSAKPAPGILVGQQGRKTFGFSYMTLVGNDLDGQDHAYKIHCVYGALAAPSERSYATTNESPEAVALSWGFETTPADITPEILVEGRALKPTSTLVFDSRDFTDAKMTELKNVLWGSPSTPARLPNPYELITLMITTTQEVTPAAPTESGDEVTIPTTVGVVYTVAGAVVTGVIEVLDPILVVAHTAPGYRFPDVVQTQWYFDGM